MDVKEILAGIFADEQLSETLKKVPVSYRKKTTDQLGVLCDWCSTLYAQQEYAKIMYILKPLLAVPFDKKTWSWIAPANIMYGVCAGLLGDKEMQVSLSEKVIATQSESYNLNRSGIEQLILNGLESYPTRLKRAEDNKSIQMEYDAHQKTLDCLLKIKLLNGIEKYSLEQAEAEITQCVARMNSIIEQVGMYKLSPFKQ